MKISEVLGFLARLEGCLAGVEEEARQTREQARQTLQLLARLREDLHQARRFLVAQAGPEAGPPPSPPPP
jgi:hypothetical protein